MPIEAARTVVVVEDDQSVRRPLVKFFEMHGFVVVTAESADEGRWFFGMLGDASQNLHP